MEIEDYNKYYIQGSEHYLIPKDVFIELFNEMINWKEESKKQKEVIDKVSEYIEKHIKYECDAAFNVMQFYSYHLYDFNKQELLDILKEVSK